MMKTKLLVPILALCAGGSLWTSPALADEAAHPTAGVSASSNPWILSQMMDARVKDLQGENLGQLKDVIIDPASGRATFAVIQLNGQVGTRGEYSPVPWALLKPSSAAGEPKSFVLKADRNKFASSQKFNLKSWPDYNEATWGPQVYSYYGLDASTLGAAVGGTGTATEMTPTSDSYRHDTRRPGTRANGTPIDNGTAPDGKGTFARGTRY